MYGFSGGEKQKISIVRQLSKTPNVLLLDEPTSALDSQSKENLIKILREEKYDRITIIISHDPKLIDISDVLMDFDEI